MNSFETVSDVIAQRRSIKPADMNGAIIPDEQVRQLLQLADWAPTHARTEPWRFVVYSGSAKQAFCSDHAELYKSNTPEEKFTQAKYENLKKQGDNLSHIIVVYMKRTPGAAIPAAEEIAAVAAATQNFLLGASALGIAALWSTGGMTHNPAMKQYLDLAADDMVMGLLLLGYTDKPHPAGKRSIPMEEKVLWK